MATGADAGVASLGGAGGCGGELAMGTDETGLAAAGGATGRGGGSAGGRTTGATGGWGATGLGGTCGATGRGGAAGCGTLGGGVAAWRGGDATVGRGVPQKPQNLLPSGNALLHFGHMTWATTAGAVGTRSGCGGGVAAAGWGPACKALPQRAHVGADAGFIFPQNPHRM